MNTRERILIAALLGAWTAACGAEGLPDAPADEEEHGTLQQAAETRSFGLHCTESFDRGWLAPIGDGYATCGNFANRLDDAATKKFYYNLKDKQYFWQDTGDQAVNSLEDVDLFFSYTHGGAWTTTYAEWGMWEKDTLAKTDQMRLGDEARGLSILATWACHILKIDDYTWGRWDSVFKGGLRAALGSHNLMFLANNAAAGTSFASMLNQNYTLKSAWVNSFGATDNASDVAVMFSGNSGSDCTSRRENMTWGNFQNYSRRRDSSASVWCGWRWDGV